MIVALASANTSFYIGLGLGFVVVVVVVVLVAVILTLASRLSDQAHLAADTMEQVHTHTAPLSEVAAITEHTEAILAAVRSARGGLGR
jgi:hypothetical protein